MMTKLDLVLNIVLLVFGFFVFKYAIIILTAFVDYIDKKNKIKKQKIEMQKYFDSIRNARRPKRNPFLK